MRSSSIVEGEIPADRTSRLGDALVGMQINFLVLDAFPQSLDEHVIPPCPFAIHADGDAVAGQHAGERRTRELLRCDEFYFEATFCDLFSKTGYGHASWKGFAYSNVEAKRSVGWIL